MSNMINTPNLNLDGYRGENLPPIYEDITKNMTKIDANAGIVEETLKQHTKDILENKANISILNGSVNVLKDEKIPELTNEVEELDTFTQNLSARVDGHNGSIADINSELTQISIKTDTTTQKVNELNEMVENANLPSFVALEKKVNINTENISNHQQTLDTLLERAINLENELNALEIKVDGNTSGIRQLEHEISQAQEDIISLGRRITTNTASISDINIEIDNIKLQIEAIETDMNTVVTNVETLTRRVEALENYQGKEGITQIKNDLQDQQNQINLKCDMCTLPAGQTDVIIEKSSDIVDCILILSTGRIFTISSNENISTITADVWNEGAVEHVDNKHFKITKTAETTGFILSSSPINIRG